MAEAVGQRGKSTSGIDWAALAPVAPVAMAGITIVVSLLILQGQTTVRIDDTRTELVTKVEDTRDALVTKVEDTRDALVTKVEAVRTEVLTAVEKSRDEVLHEVRELRELREGDLSAIRADLSAIKELLEQ